MPVSEDTDVFLHTLLSGYNVVDDRLSLSDLTL
jgi:hypothetical protein